MQGQQVSHKAEVAARRQPKVTDKAQQLADTAKANAAKKQKTNIAKAHSAKQAALVIKAASSKNAPPLPAAGTFVMSLGLNSKSHDACMQAGIFQTKCAILTCQAAFV